MATLEGEQVPVDTPVEEIQTTDTSTAAASEEPSLGGDTIKPDPTPDPTPDPAPDPTPDEEPPIEVPVEEPTASEATDDKPPLPQWTTQPDQEVSIKLTVSGPGSLPLVTVNEIFQKTVSTFPGHIALRIKRNDEWIGWTYREYADTVKSVAKSMIHLGLERYHGVGIIGFNAPEWHFAFMGTIMAGGIAAGVYSTNNKETCHYISQNCRAQLFFCENEMQINKVLEDKDRLGLKAVIQYIPEAIQPISSQLKEAGVMSWEEFIKCGENVPDHVIDEKVESQRPGHCASLVYTSGTTGPPKGVMLSHDNLVWCAINVANYYQVVSTDRFVSYLPLSHVAAQMIDILAPVAVGHTVWFAQPDALKGSLAKTLLDAQPTFFFGVPRVWEKFKDVVEKGTREYTGIKKFILEKSQNIGRQTQLNRQEGAAVPWSHFLANSMVFKGLKAKMGLTECRAMSTGAAPISKEVIDFFANFDITVCQLYALSETTGTGCINNPSNFKPYSCGRVLDGLELKIDNEDPNHDGEICFRGRNVFMGYLYAEEKTREAIDEEGWFHTGDVGSVDKEGFCYITGRSKEIIITKGGENVAPVPIEDGMLAAMKLLANVMIVGDEQRYLTMLVTIRCQPDDDGAPTDELDQLAVNVLLQIGSKATNVTEAIADQLVLDYIQNGMEKVNKSAISKAANIQKFRILPNDFSIAGGEYTPTLKVKRKVVIEKYHQYITDMYSETTPTTATPTTTGGASAQ